MLNFTFSITTKKVTPINSDTCTYLTNIYINTFTNRSLLNNNHIHYTLCGHNVRINLRQFSRNCSYTRKPIQVTRMWQELGSNRPQTNLIIRMVPIEMVWLKHDYPNLRNSFFYFLMKLNNEDMNANINCG